MIPFAARHLSVRAIITVVAAVPVAQRREAPDFRDS